MTAFNDALAELDAEIAQVDAMREQDQQTATDAVRARTAQLRDARTAVKFHDDADAGTPSTDVAVPGSQPALEPGSSSTSTDGPAVADADHQ